VLWNNLLEINISVNFSSAHPPGTPGRLPVPNLGGGNMTNVTYGDFANFSKSLELCNNATLFSAHLHSSEFNNYTDLKGQVS
jgi:hypothetical protein